MTETPQITSSCYATSGTDLGQIVWEKPVQHRQAFQTAQLKHIYETMSDKTSTRRIVQVFIADPNENVPLDQSVMYRGDQKLTDLTDTELFFDVPITELLKAHNAVRITLPDKEASKKAGRDILLEPVKIRELKMVVVTVAQF